MSLSGFVGWVERAVEIHPQNSDGGVVIDVFNVAFEIFPSVFALFGMYVVAVVTAILLFCVTHSESVPEVWE